MLGQLVRYGLTGGFVTAVYAVVYAGLVRGAGVAPMIANLFGYAVAVVLGYVLHSRWSFRGHGTRAPGTSAKFVVVSLFSLALNSAWVWIIVHGLGLHELLPLVPIAVATPLIVFWLNRVWVFG